MKTHAFRHYARLLPCLLLAMFCACSREVSSDAVLLTPIPAASATIAVTEAPTAAPSSTPEPQLRYIFLFIGDGMGPVQIEATNRALLASDAEPLCFTGFSTVGQAFTHSAGSDVTDSAAAATAIATGVKTNNGMLGLAPDGTLLTSLAERLHADGRGIGLIVTCALDDATPAAFYAHRDSRKSYADITQDLIDSGFDFLSGGGLHSGTDLTDAAAELGFTLCYGEPDDVRAPDGTRLVLLSDHPLSDGGLPYAADGGTRNGLLMRSLRLGIDRLASTGSFFIMTEGSRIDVACHYHDAGSMYYEMLDFDQAVREAIAFYEAHPNETLIVVTADHETGGMALTDGDPAALARQTVSCSRFSTDIVAAWKQDKPAFSDVLPVIQSAFGLSDLTDAEHEYLATAYAHTIKGDLSNARLKKLYGQKIYPAVTLAAANLVAARAGVSFSITGHTSTNVSVYALGLGADAFAGSYENTGIFERITELIEQYPIQ